MMSRVQYSGNLSVKCFLHSVIILCAQMGGYRWGEFGIIHFCTIFNTDKIVIRIVKGPQIWSESDLSLAEELSEEQQIKSNGIIATRPLLVSFLSSLSRRHESLQTSRSKRMFEAAILPG